MPCDANVPMRSGVAQRAEELEARTDGRLTLCEAAKGEAKLLACAQIVGEY